jgi:hypothetical protein
MSSLQPVANLWTQRPSDSLGVVADRVNRDHRHSPPGQLAIVQAAARAADAVVVPCQPTLMDLDRIRVTVDVAAEVGRPTAVLLTRTRTGTRALTAAREALEAAELPVLSTTIPQREAISAAYGERPKGEILALYAGVLDEGRRGGPTRGPGMSDMKAKMAKQLAGRGKPAETGRSPAFRAAPPAYERRVTLDLSNEDHRALKLAALEQETTMADLLRTLVAIWRDDKTLAKQVGERLSKH